MRLYLLILGLLWLCFPEYALADPISGGIAALAVAGKAAAGKVTLAGLSKGLSIAGGVAGAAGQAANVAAQNRYQERVAQAQAEAAARNAAILEQNAAAERKRQRLAAIEFERDLAVQQGDIIARQAGRGLTGLTGDFLSTLSSSAALTNQSIGISNAQSLSNFENQRQEFLRQTNPEIRTQSPVFAAVGSLTRSAISIGTAGTFGQPGQVAAIGAPPPVPTVPSFDSSLALRGLGGNAS